MQRATASDDAGGSAASGSVVLRAMPGRRTSRTGAEVSKEFVGDEPRDWWFERLRRLRPRSPARREADTLRALAALDLAVPACLAVEEPDPPQSWWPPRPGRGPRSRLRLAWVAHERSVGAALAAGRDPVLLARVQALVCRLHGAGWYHRDLYLGHLVVAPDGRPVLLDLGRARHQRRPRRRWFVKDLAALALSAPPTVSRADRLRFLRGWLIAVRGTAAAGHGERRWWVRAVLGKARRLAAHPPRRSGEPPGAHPRCEP